VTIEDHFIAGDAVSRTFRLRANGREVAVVETPPMDAAARARRAAEYRQLPDYCHIYDPAAMHLHYAHFAAAGDVTLAIEAGETIRSFRIHPLRKGLAGHAAGSVLTFATGTRGPRHFIVRINELPPLMLVVEEPETDRPAPGGPGVIDAGAFLTDRTGVTDQTENFHRAFAAANHSGRTLLVPAGTYLVTQLHVKGGRNFTLYLLPGCRLKIKPSAHGENEHRHGLWLEDCADVAVLGRGCIDQQAYEHYVHGGNLYSHGIVDYYTANELCPWLTQSPLFITGSRRILVDGLLIRNGRNFNVNCRGCEDLTLRRLKIFTPPDCTPEYADGINTGSCRRVMVEDCLVACNDDCFASGHYLGAYDTRPSQDHVVRRMLGWNLRASAVRLGFYAAHDQGDFTFEDCDFVGMIYSTLLIHPLQPSATGTPARYGAIRAVDCAFDDTPRLASLLDAQKPAIASLELVNVTFHGRPRAGAVLLVEGDPVAGIGRLRLENISLDGHRVTRLDELPHRLSHIGAVGLT
jgi:hypothetical protein